MRNKKDINVINEKNDTINGDKKNTHNPTADNSGVGVGGVAGERMCVCVQ